MSKCVSIPGGVLTLSNIAFKCPHCEHPYTDADDVYLKRCNKNKSGYTTIRCKSCGKRFNMTYNMQGDAVSFPVSEPKSKTL
jgi:transcription elongation factor Elf1